MRILIATDAWHPQVNGVVRSIEALATTLRASRCAVEMVTPDAFASIAMPTYPDIRLALATAGALGRRIRDIGPDHVHIATEGPIGFAARRACLRRGIAFTTSYHTRFPEYLSARAPIPEAWTYAVLRHFHNAGAGTMVATRSVSEDLRRRGFSNLMIWSRGVDADRFRPMQGSVLDLPRPIFLSVGRVAVEKNLEAFLSLDLPGTKVVVGDGPERAALQASYPNAVFLGVRTGEDLAALYASADVFVFPSRTDTFGNVLLEAMASGVPVAAYRVPGPQDVIGTSGAGVLDDDLAAACRAALSIPRDIPRTVALGFTWQQSARQFLDNVEHAAASSVRPSARRPSLAPPRPHPNR